MTKGGLSENTFKAHHYRLNHGFQFLQESICKATERVLDRLDNGSELTSHAFQDWARKRGIALRFIQPGKPNQNAYIERFNKTYREAVLSAYLFESIEQVQQISDDWLIDYNELRPHDSLGRVPALTYMPRETKPGESSYSL